MGIDLRAIAVRLDSPSVRRLLATDPESFWDATCRPPFTNTTWDEPLPALNQALCTEHPGLSGWDDLYPDRSYEVAEWVLDPRARRAIRDWATRERSTAFRIITGDHDLAEHATGVHGIRWRGSRATFLRAAADTIDRLDVDAARAEFSVAELSDRGTYKLHADDGDDVLFAVAVANLRRVSQYYRAVADRGLDLIFRRD
jgi:hypothetical protein